MNKLRKNQSGFTLIELMVVVIIVAVLAAVAVPLLQGNVANARSSEASAALGVIQTNMRALLAQQTVYPLLPAAPVFTAGGISNIPGLQLSDLGGRYFDDNDFSVVTSVAGVAGANPPNLGTYCIACQSVAGNIGNAIVAPQAAQAAGIARSIDQTGDIFNNATCTAGANRINVIN